MEPNVNNGKAKMRWNRRAFAKCAVCGDKWVTGRKWMARKTKAEFVCPVCKGR